MLGYHVSRPIYYKYIASLYSPLEPVRRVHSLVHAVRPSLLLSGGLAGMFPHAQILWPIYSAPALLGAPARAEDFFVLTELAGQNVGWCATQVLGVKQRFQAAEAPGEFTAPGLPSPVLFLDLQHMFS